jgi:hypothetical protein
MSRLRAASAVNPPAPLASPVGHRESSRPVCERIMLRHAETSLNCSATARARLMARRPQEGRSSRIKPPSPSVGCSLRADALFDIGQDLRR